MDLRLRPLRVDDEAEARAAHAELAQDGFSFLLNWESGVPWATYLEMLDARRRGLDLPADRVPATFLVADVGGVLVGRVSIRHELNAFLAQFGGHIGYGVRPAHRPTSPRPRSSGASAGGSRTFVPARTAARPSSATGSPERQARSPGRDVRTVTCPPRRARPAARSTLLNCYSRRFK